jgi:hypothetical protein
LLNETPSAAWRDRLLELAAADPVTAALRLEVKDAMLLLASGDTTEEILESLRALYKLFRDASRSTR